MVVALASHGWLVTVPEPSNPGGKPQTQCPKLAVNCLDNPELRRGGGHLAIALPPCRNARDEKGLASIR